ncbi:sodium/pantothenate symporter [Agathobaculum sp. TL06]
MQGIRVIELVEIVIYLIVCIGIGVYYGKKAHSSEEEYWVASRFLNGTWGAFAVYAVVGSASTIMGSAGIAYKAGLPAVMCVALGFSLQFPLIAHITAGPLLEKNICTLGDFFQDRIGGRHVRWLYAILSLIFMAAYVVPNMKASSIVGQYLMGDNFSYSQVAIVMGIVLVIYASVGGMWAVTVTDIIQGVVMMIGVVGLALAILLNCGEFGGIAGLLEAAAAARPAIAQMGYVPIAALGLAMIWGLWGLVAPMTVMRVLTMRNGKSARRSLILGSIFAAVTVIVAGFVAAVAATIDPDLANADMSYIVTMEKYFSPVIAGFFVAAIFAAIMSSVDSFLLSASSSVARDIYKFLINPQASEQTIIRLGTISLIIIGLITTGISCFDLPLISVLAGWAAGALISAFCSPLVIGLYWKGISRNGVFWSMLIGAVGYIFLNLWPAFPSMGEVIVMVPLTAVICYVVSKLSPDKEKK